MSDVALRIIGLGKRYSLMPRQERYDTLGESLSRSTTRFVRASTRLLRGQKRSVRHQDFWALRDVTFTVSSGDIVGVVGANGAGKSTLLKILSRITAPTTGLAEVHGRVGSLLEVGTGFHPELTGRENIMLNGAILGMRRSEIARDFEAIVDFSGVGQFLDTQVKRYSTGMHLRLAFAVAAHLRPEILLVDEVLAVGDAAFQKKCLSKMGDVAKTGRTVLFVSHNLPALQNLCSRALLLDHGVLVQDGHPREVIASYLTGHATSIGERVWPAGSAPGNELVRLHRVCVRPTGGIPQDLIDVRTPLAIEIDYWNLQGQELTVYVHVYNDRGILLFNVGNTDAATGEDATTVGLVRETCFLPGDLLNDGNHWVTLRITRRQEIVFALDEAIAFDVNDSADVPRNGWYGKWTGAIRPALRWRREVVEHGMPQ